MSRGGKRTGAGRPKGRASEKYVVKAFSLSPGIAVRLKDESKKQGRAMSHLVETALRDYFKP
jgi:hypothetical protein